MDHTDDEARSVTMSRICAVATVTWCRGVVWAVMGRILPGTTDSQRPRTPSFTGIWELSSNFFPARGGLLSGAQSRETTPTRDRRTGVASLVGRNHGAPAG